jgi:hypothetical protein
MTIENLLPLINQLHIEANHICKQKFGKYFANAGNIGIFCQSQDEFEELTKLKETITEPSPNPNQKYFKLIEPITISQTQDISETTYTHLYIRKPDPTPYGKFVGDIDFYTSQEELETLKELVSSGNVLNVELYNQQGVGELVQMSSPEYRTVAYISTKEMTETIRIRH